MVSLDSGPGLHHQQDRLLQQSPGGSRQISGGQATINFACSCALDHAEKEVRPHLRRHPRQVHWLPVEQRIQFKIGVLVYRCLHGNAPSYLSEMLTAAADVSGRRSLRSAACGDLNSWIWLKDVRRLWSIFLELTSSRIAGHQPD